MKTELNLPLVFAVDDYHQISEYGDILTLLSNKIKTIELAFDSLYWGLIYINDKPSQTEIDNMLIASGFRGDNKTFKIFCKSITKND